LLDLVFDTETTGKLNYNQPAGHITQPAMVQLGAILYHDRQIVAELNIVTIPVRQYSESGGAIRVPIPAEAYNIHGIDDAKVDAAGVQVGLALALFMQLASKADRLIAYNTAFDRDIVNTALIREFSGSMSIDSGRLYCAMLSASNHLKIPGRRPGQWAWPKLQDAYKALVDPKGFEGAHDAMADVKAAAAVTWALEDAGAEIVKI